MDRPLPRALPSGPSGGGISHWTADTSSPPNGRGLRGGRSKIAAFLVRAYPNPNAMGITLIELGKDGRRRDGACRGCPEGVTVAPRGVFPHFASLHSEYAGSTRWPMELQQRRRPCGLRPLPHGRSPRPRRRRRHGPDRRRHAPDRRIDAGRRRIVAREQSSIRSDEGWNNRSPPGGHRIIAAGRERIACDRSLLDPLPLGGEEVSPVQ